MKPRPIPKKILHAAATVALICLTALQTSQGAEMLNKARVSQIVNDVKKIEPSRGSAPAVLNETITGDTSVRTGIKSRSELVFPDNTVTRLGANTEFNFTGGTRDMNLATGTLLLQVPKRAGGAKITTAAVTAAITGTTVMWETIRPRKVADGVKQLIKFFVLEGTARLFLNNKPFESILVHAGQMVILPVRPLTLKDVEPISYDVERLVKTCGLIRDLSIDRKITPFSLSLVDQTIRRQERDFGDGRLIQTNLVMNGAGTDILIATDYNTTARENDAQSSAGQVPSYPGNFVIDSTTEIFTDPTIETFLPSGTISHTGVIYESEAVDGSLTSFLGGTSSAFLANLLDTRIAPSAPLAAFEFDNLTALDAPGSVDTGEDGPKFVLAASIGDLRIGKDENGIETGDLDYYGDISMAFVSLQGSINTDPEMTINVDLEGPPLALSLLAAVDVNASAGSFFILDSVAAGRDLNVGDNTELLSFGLAPIAGRDINLGNTAFLVQTIAGEVNAGRNITLGEGSQILFQPSDAASTSVSTVFANADIQLGNFASIVRDPDSSGVGGDLEVVTATGTSTLDNAKVEASGSAEAGNVKMKSGRTTGTAINIKNSSQVLATITNSSQLLALLNGAPTTPAGGRIEITSAGGEINISGGSTNIEAAHTVDVRNNGTSGAVVIDGATLAGDVVKAGALGADGTLTVRNGSKLNAGSALKLYGGSSSGSVVFTGGGQIALNGSQIDIAAFRVQIDNGTSVLNNGKTDVYATTHNYSAPNLPVNSFGSFSNNVTQHTGASSAPAY